MRLLVYPNALSQHVCVSFTEKVRLDAVRGRKSLAVPKPFPSQALGLKSSPRRCRRSDSRGRRAARKQKAQQPSRKGAAWRWVPGVACTAACTAASAGATSASFCTNAVRKKRSDRAQEVTGVTSMPAGRPKVTRQSCAAVGLHAGGGVPSGPGSPRKRWPRERRAARSL